MEFNTNLNEIFKSVISKVDHTLLPSEFTGDRRKALHVTSVVSDIVDAMGVASAKAQGLHHPITSGAKLRNCDHTLYLMIDPRDNEGKGSVVGFLKMGVKNLFLLDPKGMVHEQETLCVLDFYIHESKQRNGLGKKLFDFMLQDKNVEPCKLAMDKPPQDFFSFLYKHYGLSKIYPQSNNFLIFEGFFDEKKDVNPDDESLENSVRSDETRAEKHIREDKRDAESVTRRHEREDYLPNLYGRHTAYKLQDTMGDIIGDGSWSRHTPANIGNGSAGSNQSPTRAGSNQSPERTEVDPSPEKTEVNQSPERAEGDQSPERTKSNLSPERHGEYNIPNMYGRHAAYKLQDTMDECITGINPTHENVTHENLHSHQALW